MEKFIEKYGVLLRYTGKEEHVEIPDSIVKIGYLAFEECESIKSIKIPHSVTNISVDMFNRCKNLENIEVDEGNLQYKSIDGNLYTKDGTILLQCVSGKSNTELKIPEGVTKIENHAFNDCISLTSIKIPSSVTDIDKRLFKDCMGLKSIEVDKNNPKYNSINGSLYENNGKVLIKYAVGKENTDFKVPSCVYMIESYAFRGCTSLKNIEIPGSVRRLKSGAFENCTSLTGVKFNTGIIIDREVFLGCKCLKDIKLPYGMSGIEDGTFDGCESLEYILIPNSVRHIGKAAFRNCLSLTTVEVEDASEYLDWGFIDDFMNLHIIDDYAFKNCISLTNMQIPDSVWEIGNEAFRDCISLEEVKITKKCKCGRDWNKDCPAQIIYID